MDVLQTKTCILDKQAADRKIARMALQIAEQNTGAKHIILAGITGNGEVVAQCLSRQLRDELSLSTQVVVVMLNKKEPFNAVLVSVPDLQQAVVVLVDDVANTGKTLFYALKPFFEARPEKLQTAILVERSHKLFPIQTDYCGLSIATTLQEHIEVQTEGDEVVGAWLY